MKPKHQRLLLILVALGAVGGAAGLAFWSLGDRITYFYAPTDVARKGVPAGQSIRLGGLVAKGSVQRQLDGVSLVFTVTDGAHSVPVRYRGLVPDLFREGQGVVAEGAFEAGGVFVAQSLLARHDEAYMPREVAEALKRSGRWQADKTAAAKDYP